MEANYFYNRVSSIYLVSVLLIVFASCTTSFQDRQIKDLPGEWEVFEITTLFINHEPFKPAIEETGDLGYFEFSKSSVNYTFVRNDSLYSGSGTYSIDRERKSQKIIFSSDEDFLLLPPDGIRHELLFSDTDKFVVMTLVYYPEGEGATEGFSLRLRKID